MLTPMDVLDEVVSIKAASDDPARAHEMEKDLWEAVLKAILAGADNPAALAYEALKSRAIEFHRWYD